MNLLEKMDRSLKLWEKLTLGFLGVIFLSLVNLGVLWVFQDRALHLNRKALEALARVKKLEDLTSYHLRWKVNLLTAIINETPPQVLTQAEKCPLNRYLQHYHPATSQEAELVKGILETDRLLHASARKIRDLLESGAEFEELIKVYNREINPYSQKLFRLLDQWQEIESRREGALQGQAEGALELIRKAALGLNLLLIAGALVFLVFLIWRFNRNLQRVQEVLHPLERGDFSREIDTRGRDEFSQILKTLREVQEALKPLIRGVLESSKEVEDLTATVERHLEESAQEAEEAGQRAMRMREEGQRIGRSIEEEFKSINEISTAIQEISQNTTRASMITREAVEKARHTQEIMDRVGDSSREIEGVIQLINGIAEQTKFLALNATIEAARAGEAGKGFAVVANEVKELARQTAEATEEITGKIRAMQAEAQEAVRAVDEISQVIQEIDQIASAIATAVEEQTAVISDIAQKVDEQREGAERFSQEAEEAYQASLKALEGVRENLKAMQKLVQVAHQLAESASRFKI